MGRGHFVRRDTATGHFHLSCRLLALAFAYAERVGIPGLCAPILQALADETGELVQLAVVEEGSVLFVAKAEGPDHRLRIVPLVGAVAPLHATASRNVWLASLSQAAAAVGREEACAPGFVRGGRVRRDNGRPRAPRSRA